MGETRTVHDPFLGKDVQVSDRLVDRLRGRYASGPHLPNGNPEFGWRQFQAPPIQHEAAAVIEVQMAALQKINEIRNSIVGTQTLNCSEHVYPLVAALGEAGFEGMSYPEGRKNYGTLVERAVKAENALAAIWKIVHTPTKGTRHRAAADHFQGDFDSIRKLIAGTGVDVGGSPK